MEAAGRITVVTASIGGDLVHVACDDREQAAWLRDHMAEFGGIPRAVYAGSMRLAGDPR